MPDQKTTPDRLLTTDDVVRMTKRSRSSLFRDVGANRFPAPVRNGQRSNAWRLSEVQKWIENLPARKSFEG